MFKQQRKYLSILNILTEFAYLSILVALLSLIILQGYLYPEIYLDQSISLLVVAIAIIHTVVIVG